MESIVKKFDRAYIQNYGDRFTASPRCSRGLRPSSTCGIGGLKARERRGRPGPFAQKPKPEHGAEAEEVPEDHILHVAAFRDPVREIDKLTELYESLAEARREVGEEPVPFHKFADLVKGQSPETAPGAGSPGGGVSRGGEGREGELYGAGAEGRFGVRVGEAEGEVRRAKGPAGESSARSPRASALSLRVARSW